MTMHAPRTPLLTVLGLLAAGCTLAPSSDKVADAGFPPDANGAITLEGTVYTVSFGPGFSDSLATPAAGVTVAIRLVGSIAPDTFPIDTIPHDSLPPPDSLPFPPDTSVLDSFPPPPDTLLTVGRPFRLDSIPVDSIPIDSIPVDSIPVDTLPLPPDSLPGWACGARGTLVATVQTDAAGHFQVAGLSAGVYDILATPDSGSPARACSVPVSADLSVNLYLSQQAGVP